MKNNLISFIILISVLSNCIIGCNNVTNDKNVSDKINLTLINEIKETQIGDFTRILYASEQKVIFYGVVGLIIYDLNSKEITNVVDLKSIDMNHIQSDYVTLFKISTDGNKILMYNENHTDNTYMYDVISGKLEKTDINELEDEYKLNYIEEKELFTESKNLEYIVSIDEKKVCYLSYPLYKEKGIEDLKIVILDKETKEEKTFDVFN